MAAKTGLRAARIALWAFRQQGNPTIRSPHRPATEKARYLEFVSVYAQGHVAETLILEQQSEILGQATFRNFELNGVGLAGNVDTVGNDTDLKKFKGDHVDTCHFPSTVQAITSQKSVSLSSGKRPLASSKRKSRRMNFLNPQSLPWTNR